MPSSSNAMASQRVQSTSLLSPQGRSSSPRGLYTELSFKPLAVDLVGMNMSVEKNLRVYRNEDILRVVAFIPPGHMHVRLLIETKDQSIVLQEATVAAIVRAYIDIVTHPKRKAIEYVLHELSSDERKPGYARYQLIESNRSEDQVIEEMKRLLGY